MKIYLIRHGESTSDVKQKYEGDYDDHLTDRGIKEAEIIADKISRSKIQIIYSSSKIRARETSQIISERLKCKVKIKSELNEQDIYGAYAELGKSQPEEEYRKLGELLAERDGETEGAEAYKHFRERVIACFAKITRTTYESVAIVTHGGPIRAIFREVLNFGEFAEIGNGAIIQLEKNGSHFSVVEMDKARLTKL
jgi:broad specificity phosphatase PhoE